MLRPLLAATTLVALSTSAMAQVGNDKHFDERPAKFVPSDEGYGYTRRVVEIPMRDGTKLHTIIATPAGAHDLPMLLTRTPYGADSLASRTPGIYSSWPGIVDTDQDPITSSGYIHVYQDVRGMHKSQGIYMMNPAPVGTTFNPTKTDDSTDAYDTIAWLVKNVKDSNGRVGVLGGKLRRLSAAHVAHPPSSSAQGRGADESDGRRLARR